MEDVTDFLAYLNQAEARMVAQGRLETKTRLTAHEIADALWLAPYVDGFRELPRQRERSQRANYPGNQALGSPGALQRHSAPLGDAVQSGDGVSLRHPAGVPRGAVSTGRDALPLRLTDPRELRRTLDLQRALRPLARRIGTGPADRLDEDATATHSAEAGTVIPILTPSSERWLDLALVVDTSTSMVLWGKLVAELRQLLTQLGAFRTIRAWQFRAQGDKVTIWAPGAPHTARNANEIVDPVRRQAFLVVTDCVADAWLARADRQATAMRAVEIWARTGPLAIVQPLSRQMWSRSAVQPQHVRLHSPYPGAPNHRLSVEPVGDSPDSQALDGVPIPILEISPRGFESWSRLVSGGGSSYHLVAASRAATHVLPDEYAGLAPPEGTGLKEAAEKIVERFAAGASAEAFRLAGLLAAAPLTLSLMRHIQQAMVPRARPYQLAEVYLGGLLRSARQPGHNGQPLFEFLPGVRDVLLGTIRRSEAIQVTEMVSAELSRSHGTGESGFTAKLSADAGSTGKPLTDADVSYGDIKAQVLRRIGGHYAHLVPEPVTPGGTQIEPDRSPPAQVSLQSRMPEPMTPLARPDDEGSGDVRRLHHGITMMGAASSGKSTFLSALSLALTWQGGDWKVIPSDDASAQKLIDMTTKLTVNRDFPVGTSQSIERYRWMLFGEIRRSMPRRLRSPRLWSERIRMDLQVADPPGDIPATESGSRLSQDLVSTLSESRGIVFLFDPVGEFERGDAYENISGILARLRQRMRGSPECAVDGRLPHYVAVCVSKFDDERVLRTASELRLLTRDPDDQYGFPRVPDASARELFAALSRVSRSGYADLVPSTLETFFRPDRIRYFVTSAIGFYVDPHAGAYDHSDHLNYVAVDGAARIRGAVHPINVAEPLIWLGSRLAAQERQ